MRKQFRRLSLVLRRQPPGPGLTSALDTSAAAEREGTGNRFASVVAVVIAFTTLVAAIAGYLQADVSNRADDLRLEAEQLSLDAAASVQRSQQNAQVQYELFARSVEHRTRAANAMLRYVYAGNDPAEAKRLEAEQARWERLAEAAAAVTEIKADSEFGPQNDPIFPARYFAAAAFESHRLNALQDASNEVATFLDEQAAAYTAILAMLAVSLYLFGLTLASEVRAFRFGFTIVGACLLVVAAAWTALTAGAAQPAVSEEAAAEYAHGRVALGTAYDSDGYRAAERHFDRAIALRPTFARAYTERATAIVLAATPQRAGYVSIIPRDALLRERADLERAVELGLENGSLLSSLGFNTFLEGTQLGDERLLEQSIAYTRRAIQLDPTEPVHRYNLGVALVAAGRYEEARAAYDEAMAWTLYTDADRTRLRQAPAFEEHVLAGALTDLEIVRRFQPAAEDQIRAMKEYLVGPIAGGQLVRPEPSPLVVGEVQLDISPGQIGWQAHLEGYEPLRDVISTQWYYQDPAEQAWAVLPTVSGTLRVGVADDGRHYVNAYYVTSVNPPACLSPGLYRLEIYVNGRLVAPAADSDQAEPDFAQLDAYVGHDVAMAFCHQPDWQPLGEEALPGLLDGFRSADGQYGVYVMRVGLPRSLQQLPNLTTEFMDLGLETFGELIPGTPKYDEASPSDTEHFVGLPRSVRRWYRTDGGLLFAAAGVGDDGAVVLGLIFGPEEWFADDAYWDIMGSMFRLD